ncbi:sigma-70 family RNA polymerase sigma factor [Nocardioides sp. YIM 152315]|uniref:sigma-70 family RNA polymerase sigma factor n=1 Tax=Nocardioides sp. YIM 152315 TaxID=3031760 RepID=UPI0023DC42ED|nr:sigma-70 family RNA polymerase sigma factor [Nocardioides sp. YIM 152315]MDF1602041.1 sigma-70 family RNA polymerase sigma factor [Nocardioides sp. YIM 152315]
MPAIQSQDAGADQEVGRAGGDLSIAVTVYLSERTRLLHLAQRIVGDAAAAEDVVQDAWVRWQRVDRTAIHNPAAFLTTVTTHLAINVIQSARHRHELPSETLVLPVSASANPVGHTERRVAIETTLGYLMSKLGPAELAVFVLRKCFEYPYEDVAQVTGVTVPNARQLVRRAHISLSATATRPVDIDDHRELVAAFTAAADLGEMERLLSWLAASAERRRDRPTRHPRRAIRPTRTCTAGASRSAPRQNGSSHER